MLILFTTKNIKESIIQFTKRHQTLDGLLPCLRDACPAFVVDIAEINNCVVICMEAKTLDTFPLIFIACRIWFDRSVAVVVAPLSLSYAKFSRSPHKVSNKVLLFKMSICTICPFEKLYVKIVPTLLPHQDVALIGINST